MRDLRLSLRTTVVALVVCGALYPARPAHAICQDQGVDPSFNLTLECLVDRTKGTAEPNVREQSSYRSLVSELSAGLALPMLEPADTLGFNGFHFSFDSNFTTFSSNASYWSGPTSGVQKTPMPVMPVLSIMLRKGIWMPLPPLPSVELGLGASNLANSDLFAVNGYFKLAIHEGYHNIKWLPSIAARAAVTRMAGSSELDLTLINVDGVLSKAFGAAGTFTLEPYLGGGVMWSIARSQVIDTNPTLDLYRGPVGVPNFNDMQREMALSEKIVFPTEPNIMRWRVFAGLHFHYSILALTAGFTLWGAGADHGADLSGPTGDTSDLSGNSAKDLSGFQYQVNFSAGLRF